MSTTTDKHAKRSLLSADGITAPLRHAVFRRIWLASLLTNLGLMINGVGAAWAMTQMTSSASMVALVQTALMLPIMLLSLAAGAIADMYDRRLVGLIALLLGLVGAVTLAVLAYFNAITPNSLLLFCFMIGSGMALFGPAWQASVSEQVPAETLPAAVALNGISYNIARSFGPALGGIIVAAAGAVAAFVCNVLLYIPLIVVLYLWQRTLEPSRLPPERLRRAVVSGVRYIVHSPPIRIVLYRTLVTGIAGGSVLALLPLVARDILHGGAQTYGIMLGCFGMGGVLGALNISSVRTHLSGEHAVRLCALTMGLAIGVLALSRWPALTGAALVVAGASWMIAVTLFNIGVQLSTPRWVAGRALAAYQAAIAGGVAIGSWLWGYVANGVGIGNALLIAGAVMFVSPVLAIWLRMPSTEGANNDAVDALEEPEVNLSISQRSGPIVVEIEYRVSQQKARAFYTTMLQLQAIRQRNGAYDWSIARDIADPELWIERYHCPTWLDYLRQRNRSTQSEREIQLRAIGFHLGPEPIKVHRMLERPLGSVRWKDETPDRTKTSDVPIETPASSGV
ncbi:MFS transporter [Afipia massiliensis]|uniref:MFS transporter n=1 Tax=Afipia massiliensis TaxID=211460 RepID=A0A4U6BLT7_9BRAD|nr:MFS transporter [Afipia massiliensis]TKT70801.1 MFS transporter [Afipia massiliensis]